MQDSVPLYDSKSKRKRQMIALQKTGEALVTLSAAQLSKIPLDSVLLEAITAARSFSSHEAKRRQFQYIGRLMREIEDIAPIQAALDKLTRRSRQSKAQFHQIEQWRDKLVAGNDQTIQAFLLQFPCTDRPQLRQLIRNARNKKGPDRQLFRYLKSILDAKGL